MNQFFLVARQAIQKDLSGLVVAELIALELPRILLLTIPMGVLLGVLVGLGRLSADSEITALRASGVSYYRVARPVVALGVLFFIFGMVLYHYVGPKAHTLSSSLTSEVLAGADLNLEVRPRVFFDSIPGTIVYCRDVRSDDPVWPLRGVLIRTEDQDRERILIGQRGRIDRDAVTGRLTFRVDHGELHLLDPANPAAYTVSRFSEPFTQSFLPPGLQRAPAGEEDEFRKGIPDMTDAELDRVMARHAEKTEGRGDPMEDFGYRRALVEKTQRTAVPFAAIAFALLGLPLGIISRRGGRSSGFAVSLIVIVFYWVGFSIARNMALEGTIGIIPGVWGANIVLVCVAGLLILVRQKFESFSPIDSFAAASAALLGRLPGTRGGIARALQSRTPGMSRGGPSRGISPRFALGVPILDRHVTVQFLKVLSIVVLSACTIVWVIVSRNFLDMATTEVPVSAGLLFRYLVCSTPGAAWYLLPISAMIAAMTSLGLLERNNEITAMKAAGVSLYRISAPILVVTAALCGLYFLVQEYVAPPASQEALRIEDTIQGRSATVAPGTRWIFGDKQLLYGYRNFDPASGSFGGLALLDFSDDFSSLRRRTWADSARWNGTQWVVVAGWNRTWKEGGEVLATDRFTAIKDEPIELADSPAFFARREQSFLRGARLPEEMSIRQLHDYLDSSRRSGFATKSLEVALYAKTAFPATPLVMVLLGLPFAFRTARRGALYGVGVAMGLILVYWAVFAIFNALGIEGLIHPIAAAWVPNFLFGIAGAWMFLSVRS